MSSNSSSGSGSSLAALVTKAKEILGSEVEPAILKCLLSQSQILRDCVMNRPEELPGLMDDEVIILTGDDLETIKQLSGHVQDRMGFASDDCPSDVFILTPEDKKTYEYDSSPEIRNVFTFLKRYSNGEAIGEYIESDVDGSVSVELYPGVLPHPSSFLAEESRATGTRAPEPSTLEYLMFSKPKHSQQVRDLINIGMLVPSTSVTHPHAKPQPKRRATVTRRTSHRLSSSSSSSSRSSYGVSSNRTASYGRRTTKARLPAIRRGSSNSGKPGQVHRGKTQKRGRSPRRLSPRGTRRRQ